MNIFKKITTVLFLAVAMTSSAFAAEANTSAAAAISHLEKAIAEVNKSDFNSAQVHLKAARSASEQVTGNETTLKQAYANIIEGQKGAKLGDVKKSADALNKAVELYKSL